MKIQVGKKELSEKQKKILRKVKVILQYVFIFLGIPNSVTDNRNRFGNYFEFYSNVPFDFDCVNVSNFIAT